MKTEKILSGIAGEYFVAGEFSRRGMVAAVTLRNNANIDILVTSSDGSRTANIQVKTRRVDKSDGWDLGSEPLEAKKEWGNIFYVFVAISSDPEDRNIDFYIIPKNKLNKKLEATFQWWKKGKKRSGKPRKSDRRIFRLKEIPEFEKLKDRWDIVFAK